LNDFLIVRLQPAKQKNKERKKEGKERKKEEL